LLQGIAKNGFLITLDRNNDQKKVVKKMKRILLTMVVLVAFPVVAMAGITGSSHDFSDDAWSAVGGTNTKCEPCHTPHNGNLAVTDAPLWNHTLTTASGFTPYGAGFDMEAATGDPAGISLLCLSCHDGATALDSFGGADGPGPTYITGVANFGTDLSNDHPISFTYNDAMAGTDGELHPPTTTSSGLGAEINDDMLFGAGNDQLECASCHDVHNSAGLSSLLRITNAGSALCTTCHNK
jgi:predicted CXXCH cytochrome family protein